MRDVALSVISSLLRTIPLDAGGGLGSRAGPGSVIRDVAMLCTLRLPLLRHASPSPPGCPGHPAPHDGAGVGATRRLPGRRRPRRRHVGAPACNVLNVATSRITALDGQTPDMVYFAAQPHREAA
jgi:hypothetical protein